MNQLIDSSLNKQELINHYEQLRLLVIDKSSVPSGNLGYSILLFRGMNAWMNVCFCSEFIDTNQSIPFHSEKIKYQIENKPITLPHAIQEEAVMILTNIMLSHQQQDMRSYYA